MPRIEVLLLLCGIFCSGQHGKAISGTIVVANANPGGVRIINATTEKEAVTDAQGHFSIVAGRGDLLLFSSGHLDFFRHIVEDEEYEKGYFSIVMTSKVRQLDEVEVRPYTGIDAVSMRILSKPAKTYTPAERRLRTARHVFVGPVQGGGTGITIDPVINFITGRTARLKSDLLVERQERVIRRLKEWYPDEYYPDKLSIPAEAVEAFRYYCADDRALESALDGKRKAEADFRLHALALAFRDREPPVVTNRP